MSWPVSSMPGAFLDHETTRFDHLTARPSFFLPPSPSASSVLSQSVRSSSPTKDTRKRPKVNTRTNSNAPRSTRASLPSTTSYSYDAPSPAPLVRTDYIFAGGTPSTDRYTAEDASYVQDLRPNRYMSEHAGYFPQTPQTEQGGKRRRLSTPRGGWGRTVWNLTGGMAGKAINYCWTVAFQGFHAGQGQGYDMGLETPVIVPDNPYEVSARRDVFDDEYEGSRSTPVPGRFPEEDHSQPQIRQQSYQQIPTPTASNDWGGTSSLKSNWVMVDAPSMRDVDSSPARKRLRPSTANLYAKPVGKPSVARPRMTARHSASFASSRASLGGASNLIHDRIDSSRTDSPKHKRSRSSIASPRRSESGTCTPKSPDVIKFEKKIHKQHQKQDDSMKRLNQQMQDMIREAQEALGSKVEVVDEDEGYHEGFQATSYGSTWS